jgi:hypothetical protein
MRTDSFNQNDPKLAEQAAAVCGTYREATVKSGLRPMWRRTTGSDATWTRGRPTPDVGDTWKSDWIFRPHTAGFSAVNYQFVPSQMRRLFEAGINDFAHRCGETLETLRFKDPDRKCADNRLKALVAGMVDQFKTPVSDTAPFISSCKRR